MPTSIDFARQKPTNGYLSLREQKKRRLIDEQHSMKAFKSTPENLRAQQNVLKNALLMNPPSVEIKQGKVMRIREQEKLNKDILLRRRKQVELDSQLKKKFNINQKGLFFPFADVRIKSAVRGGNKNEVIKEMRRKQKEKGNKGIRK